MKTGQLRYCSCGCGEVAKKIYSGNRFKSWRAYASGHAPNERLDIHVPSTAIDLAYAAGIVDGEGCIWAKFDMNKQGMSTFLQLQITMCSENVVAWFAQTFGGSVYIQQPKSFNYRAKFTWQIRGRQVGIVLSSLIPYLKEKKQRAYLAIELSEILGRSTPGRRRKISEEELSRRRELASSIKAFNHNLRSEDVVQ